jgi:DNA modification methylase
MSFPIKVDDIKYANKDALSEYLEKAKNPAEILYILKNIGKLPHDFEGDQFLEYLTHQNPDIRFWAVKNLGKLSNPKYAESLFGIANQDSDSMVRREAVSSIGRMREDSLIPYFMELLEDADPKIVVQAVRALLVFKGVSEVDDILKQYLNHSNEQVQLILKKEFGEDFTTQDYGTPLESPSFMKNVAILGDVREVLDAVPDGSVHLTFTSPPYYNARDYSIYDSYEGYLDFLEDVFRKVHRITKEGRFLIVNTSPIIIPRISRAHSSKRYAIPFDLHARLVSIGWEFIDDIVWEKPETSVKNRNAGFLQHRKPLGYKPNPVTEYIMVYRKETTRILDWNMRQYNEQTIENSKINGNYETSNIWKIQPKADKVHSAIFPQELCHRVISFYSYVGDLVFDPFGGSGTLGVAAKDLQRFFFLTEIAPEYFNRMQERLQNNIFQTKPIQFMSLAEFKQEARSDKQT